MNNIEDLKHYVDEKLETIIITEDIKNNILEKSIKKKAYNLKYVALLIVPMILVTCIFFNEPIGYAAQNILRYVPIINKLVTDTDHKQYGISDSIKIQINENTYIKVNSAYTDSDNVILNIEGNVLEYEKINIVNKNGVIVELKSLDFIRDLDSHEWSGRFIYDFDKASNEFDIVYDNHKLPIIMTELRKIEAKELNFISIENINIDIAVITSYVNNHLKVNLLAKSNNPNEIISFPIDSIYLLDDKGKKYYCSSSDSENILYFDCRLEANVNLVIPYVSIEDEMIESIVTINKKDVPPINVNIGDYDLIIKEIKWTDNNEPFELKTEDGEYISAGRQKSQKLELLIDKNLFKTQKLNLQNIAVDINKNDLIEHKKDGVKMLFSDPIKEDNSIEKTQIKKIISDIKNENQEIELIFSSLIIHTENEIIIPLQK